MIRRMALVPAVLVAILSVWSARGADVPPVLTEVPETAQVVIVVKDIKGLADKLSTLATRLDLPVPQDLIGMITKNIGVKEGLDQSGSMAVVLMPAPKAAAADAKPEDRPLPPEPILIIPTTNADALLVAFKPAPEKDGISEVTMPNDSDEKGYVARREKFIVLATQREHLQRYLAVKGNMAAKLSPETLATINANDIAVYANIPEISKAYGNTVNQYLKLVSNMMSPRRGGDTPVGMVILKESADLSFSAVRNFLDDADSSLLTFRITDAGVTLGASGTFKKDSTWGKFIAAQKPNREVSLKGLPNAENPLAAGSIYLDSSNITMLLSSLLNRVGGNPAATAAGSHGDFDQTTDAIRIQKQMAEISTGGSFAIFTPKDARATGWIHASFLIETSDAAGYIGGIAKLVQLGNIDTTAAGFKTTVAIKENAETIQGVSVNRITFSVAPVKEGAALPAAALAAIEAGGASGITLTTAAVGKRAVLVVSSDAKLVEAAIVAAKKDSADLATTKENSAVSAQVLPNPAMVVYLPVDRWIALAHLGVKPAAGSQPGLAPPTPTPVVLSANVEAQTVHFELFVPMSTLTTAVDTLKSQFGMFFGM